MHKLIVAFCLGGLIGSIGAAYTQFRNDEKKAVPVKIEYSENSCTIHGEFFDCRSTLRKEKICPSGITRNGTGEGCFLVGQNLSYVIEVSAYKQK